MFAKLFLFERLCSCYWSSYSFVVDENNLLFQIRILKLCTCLGTQRQIIVLCIWPNVHRIVMNYEGQLCNVLLTVHRDISVQYEPTGWAIYFQFISIINLYMFRSRLAAHHQEVLLCNIQQLVYVMRLCLLAVGRIGSCQQPVNINAWHIPVAVCTE